MKTNISQNHPLRLTLFLQLFALMVAGILAITGTVRAQVPVVSPAAQAAHATIMSYDGPGTCVACHQQQAQQMFGSVHYQEIGDTPAVPNINGPAGKGRNGSMVMNSYCGTPTTSSRATCATCHAGNGRIPSTVMTTQQLTNIDCMMCHQDAYKRVPAAPMQTISFPGANGLHSIQAPIEDETGFQYTPDVAKMTVSILDAARTVHRPTRASCLRCHAGAGGSDGGKRGDISTVTVNPPVTSDVHMSPQGANLGCINCHSVGGHRVAGRGVDLRPSDSTNLLSCANCHTARPHGDYSATTSSSRDGHAAHVACQSCHIPKYAKDKSTEMERTWLEADFSMAACRGQGGWVPHDVRATNVIPIYEWFDGTSLANVLGQVPVANAAGEYVLALPNGSVQAPGAKLYPMKLHRSDSARQDSSGLLIPHSTFSFFTSGDFTKAVHDGQALSGLEGSASVVPVMEYQTINHGVEASTNALQCGACHSSYTAGGPVRMDLKGKLGYALKGVQTQVCSQCHGNKSNPGFASVHNKHVTDKRYDCSSCHNFSRPERGLTRISVIRPAAPSGPVATPVSAARIDLVWGDNSTTEQGFKVERSSDGVTFTQIGTASSNVTTAADTSVTAGASYYYRVRAYNATGDSDYSLIGRATTSSGTTTTPPAAPTGLSATVASSAQINLSWTDNANNEAGFVIERSTDNVTFTQVATVGANATSYPNTGLSAGTTYYYRVRAYTATDYSGYSNTASATTTGLAPATPGNLTAVSVSSSQINLSWTDNANNETGFAIERSTDNVTFIQIATVGANVAVYANTGLNAGTTYYYRIRAYNGTGNSAFSNTASATTQEPATPVITWANPAPITYGIALSSRELNASANVSGTFAYTPAASAILNAGSGQTLSVVFTPTDTQAYRTASATVTLDVLKQTLTVTAGSATRRYGAANPVFTGMLAGVVNNDGIQASYACAATAASPVGAYPIVASLSDPNGRLANYTVAKTDGTLSVTPAPLSIRADDKTKEAGQPTPTLTASYVGFVNGETSANLDAPVVLATSATTASPAGTYAIVASGAADANYAITFVNGTLTITPAPVVMTGLSVQPANATITVGQTQQFTARATYSDGSTTDVTSSVVWQSSATAVATVTSGGRASGVQAGTTTVSASLTGFNATASLTVSAGGNTGTRTFSSSGSISIRSSGPAAVYPSKILVSGMAGTISKVTVKLNNLTHGNPDDLDILLVGPSGQKIVLMSDAGGSEDASKVTLTFDDAAGSALPDNNKIRTATYRPANYQTGDSFAAPAPAGPYASALSAFNNTDANGTWTLFIIDDRSGNSGSLGSWSLNITTTVIP